MAGATVVEIALRLYSTARIFVRPGVKMRKLTLFAACATSLAACASPPPNVVGVFVETFPPGASCIVSRGDQPIGQIDQTPGIATVPNQEADYLVSCRRSGFADVDAVVHARAITTYFVEYLGGNAIHPPGGASIKFALTPRWPTVSTNRPGLP
jgi:hypothetical protein